ncbi:MAG: DsrE/DsrF/DrsH-like family protein [Dehalococcoidia bacterium]|nr:DsrE/DsrF/DrsH-like family protein [Dehalococcoidia bacterium]MDD5493619.1 DsrE/DsrF/DrsH-like family protein [Dehalococcoidia bacterium]
MADKEKMTLIMFSGEMDKVLAAFNIAIGGASSGMDVTMFFTFWGLNVIKKNEGSIKSKGIMRNMLNYMNRGGAKRLPLSKFHMAGAGKAMMQRLMKDINFPQVDELMRIAKELGVKFIACTTTMGMMGITKDAFITEVDSFAGVATYIAVARESKINLFI